LSFTALKLLSQHPRAEQLRLSETGNDILSLAKIYDGERRIIILCAVRSGERSACFHRFDPTDEDSVPKPLGYSPHIAVVQGLKALQRSFLHFSDVQFIIMGLEPEKTAFGEGLSESVKQALPRLVSAVVSAALEE